MRYVPLFPRAVITDRRDTDAVFKYADINFPKALSKVFYPNASTPADVREQAEKRNNFLAAMLYNPEG